MLTKCPECGNDVAQGAKSCPRCGKKLGQSTAEACLIGCAIAIAAVVVIVGVLFLIGAFAASQQTSRPVTPLSPPPTDTTATVDTRGPIAPIAPDEAFLKTKAGRIWKKHGGAWSEEDCRTIANGQINVGMSGEMVRASWGRPEHINESTYRSGTHEQWVYGSRSYVYLQNGVVTSISTTHE
jgi:hypothetical protein